MFSNQNLVLCMSTILLLHWAGGSYADSLEAAVRVCQIFLITYQAEKGMLTLQISLKL